MNEDAYWWDAGTASNDATWSHCLAAKLTPIPSFRGYRMAGFNLGLGRGNALIDSVAVGNLGNSEATGFIWPESGSGLWTFQSSIAHNNKSDGLFVWQNNDDPHVIEDFVAFRNGNGIEHGAYLNAFAYERCATFENGRGLRLSCRVRERRLGSPALDRLELRRRDPGRQTHARAGEPGGDRGHPLLSGGDRGEQERGEGSL